MIRLLAVSALFLAACSKKEPPAPPAAAQTCDAIWSKVEPAPDAKGKGSVRLEDGVLVLEGEGALDPCFRPDCTGSNGRLHLAQANLTGDFDATLVVDALTGGEADLVFFAQSETGSERAILRLGQEGGRFGVGLDLLGGDATRSLVEATPEGSARLRLQRKGDELTLTGRGIKGGEVSTKTKLAGPLRVGLGWSSFDTGTPVTARISALEATGAVQPDAFDCPRFLPDAAL